MRWVLLLSCLSIPALAWGDAASDAAALDELWGKRTDPAVAKDLDGKKDAAVKASPADYALLWRAARWKWWQADGTSGDLKKRLGKEAWELGDRAVKVNPNGVEGQYFTAVSIGAYSQAVGVLHALGEGLESKFNDRLDTAMKLDAAYASCGPIIAKGRYYFELPWPKRSLSKSAGLLGKAVAQCGTNIRAYVYLAETQLKDGDAKKAKETLAKAPADVTYDPAEGQRAQAMAKRIQADVDKELK
jgi:hypothetical protein